MRAVVQRSHAARVEVDGHIVGAISRGLVAFVGAERGDTDDDVRWVSQKIVGLRVFPDENGKMSRALADLPGGGELLVVSQFTLFGDVKKGRRPSFEAAEEPVAAARRVEEVVAHARQAGLVVATGRFGADMQIHVHNDGPVTLVLDSRTR
jgi:D-tyrosyl-tRNA(Tyr) deacylase